MHGALVIRGGPKVPDLVKAQKFGINRFCWEAEDPALDGALLDAMRAKGFEVAIMREPSWHQDSPESLAKRLHDDINRLGYGSKPLTVQADIEIHSNEYVIAFLKAWRALRPTRKTEWTMEGFQGGWFSPELVNAINADVNLIVVPQAYQGNMTPWPLDQVRVDVLARGINCARYKMYYASVPANGYWDGYVYDFTNAKQEG